VPGAHARFTPGLRWVPGPRSTAADPRFGGVRRLSPGFGDAGPSGRRWR